MHLSNYAFHHQGQVETLSKIFLAAREELLLQSMLDGKIFVESNHCLTFYAHQIARLLQGSKFVHIVRHPGDFVRSAIMKGWHKNDTIWEIGRVKSADTALWERLSQLEKNAWVWQQTHQFIDRFLASLQEERKLIVRFEDLVENVVVAEEFASFIANKKVVISQNLLSTKINKVKKRSNEPLNLHKIDAYPTYEKWSDSDKMELKYIIGTYASKFDYSI